MGEGRGGEGGGREGGGGRKNRGGEKIEGEMGAIEKKWGGHIAWSSVHNS